MQHAAATIRPSVIGNEAKAPINLQGRQPVAARAQSLLCRRPAQLSRELKRRIGATLAPVGRDVITGTFLGTFAGTFHRGLTPRRRLAILRSSQANGYDFDDDEDDLMWTLPKLDFLEAEDRLSLTVGRALGFIGDEFKLVTSWLSAAVSAAVSSILPPEYANKAGVSVVVQVALLLGSLWLLKGLLAVLVPVGLAMVTLYLLKILFDGGQRESPATKRPSGRPGRKSPPDSDLIVPEMPSRRRPVAAGRGPDLNDGSSGHAPLRSPEDTIRRRLEARRMLRAKRRLDVAHAAEGDKRETAGKASPRQTKAAAAGGRPGPGAAKDERNWRPVASMDTGEADLIDASWPDDDHQTRPRTS